MKRWMIVGLIGFMSYLYAGEDVKKTEETSKALEIKEVKDTYDIYITSLNTTVDNYIKILNKEEEIFTKKGNLEILESIEKEREAINVLTPSHSSVDWKKNKNLVLGQKSFNSSLNKNKKDFLGKLESIQKKMVQDKNRGLSRIICSNNSYKFTCL